MWLFRYFDICLFRPSVISSVRQSVIYFRSSLVRSLCIYFVRDVFCSFVFSFVRSFFMY